MLNVRRSKWLLLVGFLIATFVVVMADKYVGFVYLSWLNQAGVMVAYIVAMMIFLWAWPRVSNFLHFVVLIVLLVAVSLIASKLEMPHRGNLWLDFVHVVWLLLPAFFLYGLLPARITRLKSPQTVASD